MCNYNQNQSWSNNVLFFSFLDNLKLFPQNYEHIIFHLNLKSMQLYLFFPIFVHPFTLFGLPYYAFKVNTNIEFNISPSTNVYHVQHDVQFFPNLIIMKIEVIEDERLFKSNHIRPIIITTGPLTSIGFCVNLLA
jgi:hypothetical protein